jgi:hypothetical protein
LFGVPLVFAVGCADVTAPGAPLIRDTAAVAWMEWASEIAYPGTGAPVRLGSYRSGCGRFRVQLSVTAYNVVAITPFEERAPNEPCPLYEDRRAPIDVIGVFDTIVTLPALPATTPRTPYALSAPTWDYFGTAITRIFGGFDLVAGPADTTLRVAGRAELVADSVGCSWAYAQAPFFQGRTMVLDSLLDLGAARRFAFVRGRLLPVSPPRCGQSLALQLEGALVEY